MHAMYEQFKERAQAVSAQVHRLAWPGPALDFILEQLKALGVADASGSRALWAPGPLLASLDQAELARRLPGLRFDVGKESAAQAKVGISQFAWGLANTGSLAGDCSAVEQRLVSTLPEVHIALLPVEGLLPDLPTLLERLDPEAMAYVAVITGPSRTADIERVLTIGVHGPEQLIIICLDQAGEVQ